MLTAVLLEKNRGIFTLTTSRYRECSIHNRSSCILRLNPTSEEIVNKRWIDDLYTPDRCMVGPDPLPNQNRNQGVRVGPWVHRFFTTIIILLTIYLQNEIQDFFDEINIMNELIRVIIQFLIIVFLLGFGHKLLRSNN